MGIVRTPIEAKFFITLSTLPHSFFIYLQTSQKEDIIYYEEEKAKSHIQK